MENHLKDEISPYLLQHKDNPVNWYPWCGAAFDKARKEDKPVFLSVGYSTCHWCHVMAHESFEDTEVASVLNRNFVSVKVDKEERPDIDSIYMNVCQMLTGSGGWPMSVFLTPDQKPFYAGTYFSKSAFLELLDNIASLWKSARQDLMDSSDTLLDRLRDGSSYEGTVSEEMLRKAEEALIRAFDPVYGGFGGAPKFPMPQNLLYLLERHRRTKEPQLLHAAEKTLERMYRGGLFDQIGFGFSRYSTDRSFLVPHFEKMLYDNALLILCYTKAYTATGKALYCEAAVKTADYVLREMTSPDGGFYSAQDADSEGIEGAYYVFDYHELIKLLGTETGRRFNAYYGITPEGNFEGRNIPNLLACKEPTQEFDSLLPQIYEYRKARASLHLDDKILTAWNGLMIAAFAQLYRVTGDRRYMAAAKEAVRFIGQNLWDGERLFVSFRQGKRGGSGFLDDYAFYTYALLALYETTLEQQYLDRAADLIHKATEQFWDKNNGGFYLYGREAEQLVLKPKETYDGALPSGNSVMAFNLVRLSQILEDVTLEELARKQLEFMAGQAEEYPAGYCFYLLALSHYLHPPTHIVCCDAGQRQSFPDDAVVRIIPGGSEEYPLINGKTTYYVCRDHKCLPPSNELEVAR